MVPGVETRVDLLDEIISSLNDEEIFELLEQINKRKIAANSHNS